jgi:hypothetical protein
MSAEVVQIQVPATAADAAGGDMSSLPLRKRQAEELEIHRELKIAKISDTPPSTALAPTTAFPPATAAPQTSAVPPQTTDASPQTAAFTETAQTVIVPTVKARKVRLDQNRKAAKESRRRKKCMIEELQRSVIFFSRANGTLKQQNDELSRLLIQAQAQTSSIEGGQKQAAVDVKVVPSFTANPSHAKPASEGEQENSSSRQAQQAQAQAVATQAVYESQGFPAAAARAVAQTINGGSAPVSPSPVASAPSPSTAMAIPAMQTGATMQAMASFQQAATAAMQSAMLGMQDIPGMNMSQLAAQPVGANAQQAYTDTMTALAMQQAAAAAVAGHQFASMAFFAYPGFSWPQPPAQLAQQPPAQLAQQLPAQLAQQPPAQLAQQLPAQLAQQLPAQLAQQLPAQLAQQPQQSAPVQPSPGPEGTDGEMEEC